MATLTTPRLAIPYPDGAERVMDGDNAMGAIATKVDGLGVAFALAAGVANVVAPGGTTNPSLAVTFPVGRFTVPPVVVANLGSASLNFITNISTPTATGFTTTVFHNTAATNVAANTYPVNWIATQILPGSAAG